MPRAGGEADKLGNQYEAVWTVNALIDVFLAKFRAITVEAFGDESKGVEFHLETLDNRLQFHSVKRQKQGGDWSVADLCRANAATARSVLGDLFEKRLKHPDAEMRFVSATGANELRELSERAETPTTVSEFRSTLPAKLQNEFDRQIVPLVRGDEEFAFAALKALEVILRGHKDLTRSVEQRIEELFYCKDCSALKPDEFRRTITEFIVGNLGRRLDTGRIRDFVDANGIGIRDWKTDQTVNEAVARINKRYLAIVETELINSAQIIRDEANQIICAVSDSGSNGALLVAPGGYGKSCVLAQAISQLSVKDIPFMCLRMDSLQLCATSQQLGGQLDLPASPVVVLAGVADNAPSVLVVDQLDAMSLVSGRNFNLWEVFSDLCNEVHSYPNMKMILASRDFDLNHDHRLRGLGDSTSGFTKITLGKLSKEDIRGSLDAGGLEQLAMNDRQLEILGVPFHLLLFLQGDPSRDFSSVGELYNRYWERKRQNINARLGRESHWNQVINALTERMSEQQVLFAPKVLVDDWENDAQAMASEHVLVEGHNQYRFFHESFFDYAYARRFCATGRSVVAFLLSTEQHLFRRAQVRQILAYRREHDFSQYIKDVREIFATEDVRFHIKRMVASGFHQVDKPTREEWLELEPYLLEGDLSRYVSPALRNHVGWFDLLDSLQVFENWLASADERLINAAIWFLESLDLHDKRSARIAELIRPYVDRDDDWQKRMIRILSMGNAYKSDQMRAIYLKLVERGTYDDFSSGVTASDYWNQHYNPAKECPKFFVDILATWFDRAVERFDDGESWNFLDNCRQNHSHTGAQIIGRTAADVPEYFIEQMLPRAAVTILKTEVLRSGDVLNRAWPWLTNHGDPFDINDAVLLHLRKALQWLAKYNVELFRKHASTIVSYPHETFGYLLLRSWAENPEEFAEECAEYLVADQRRLNIGYGSWSGDLEGTGESAISRIALQAISPHCSAKRFKLIETAIIGYCDEYEKQTPRRRGYAELLLLRSLDRTRISEKATLRIEELERKFPDVTDAIVKEDKTSLAKCVGSPIPQETAELMTDDQWISAMQEYDGSTDRFRGGPVELSRLLADFARRNRTRFAALVTKIPDNVNSLYFSAILDGLCTRYSNLGKEEKEADQIEIDATPTETFLSVIDRLHSLPGRPCGSAIVGCIRTFSDRQLPAHVLDIVSFYATSDPDPETDIWQDKSANYYGGNPYDHGINCVRGQAAEAISTLLYGDKTRLDTLRPTLKVLCQDPVISVRTCAINALMPLLNFARDEAVDLFGEACNDCEAICGTPTFERFVNYALHSHYPQLRDLLQFALNSEKDEAIANASRQIILAELAQVDVGADALTIRKGSETMRRSATEVYAKNLSHDVVGDKCVEHLQEFFDDEDESVRRQVSSAFWGLSGERLLQLEGYIGRYIERKCFENETDNLLHSLEQSNVELPHVVCRAAERILEFVGEEGTHIAYHESMVAHTIAKLIVRQYEQTTNDEVKTHCLDLIDRIERMGYYGMGDELNRIDR